MATRRVIVYSALAASAPLLTIIGSAAKILPAGRMVNVPAPPFVTYRMHQAAQLQGTLGRQDFVSVWAHDVPGDYMRIDDMISAINTALQGVPAQGHLLEVRWFEESPDLQDDDMGTITKNTRFLLTSATPERHT